MKNTSAGWIHGAWHLALKYLMGSVTFDLRIWYGYRIQEGAGVRMHWAIKQFITAGEFNQVAKIHDRDPV
jgi:hypothetical protein